MADQTVAATITGGHVQGVTGAGTVHIANFAIYNRGPDEHGPAQANVGPIPPCPYPGLAYFGPNEGERFFGRDVAIERLSHLVHQQSLAALVGASGSGKSSTVLAGLAPHLHRTGNWRFAYFRIGAELTLDPFQALARALVPLITASEDAVDRLTNIKKLAVKLAAQELTLGDIFSESRSLHKGGRILLIADQFEEALTLIVDETVRQRFVDVLLDAFVGPTADPIRNVCLVLTLRADFYGRALEYRPLADALQGRVENLGPMNRKELQAAIVRPAEKAKVSFEPGLVDTLLDDVTASPGSLPLLQFALREMWERQAKAMITRESYEIIGRVQGALARRAEAIFSELTRDGMNAQMVKDFQRLFTRLVTVGDGQEDTRRVARRQELGDDVWSLAQRLAGEGNRLVVTNGSAPSHDTAELVHEALIRHWPKLAYWIEQDRAFLSWLRLIKPNIDLWSANQADEAPLLRGSMLSQALKWLSDRAGDLSDIEQDFVKVSSALDTRLNDERVVLDTMMRSLGLSDLTDRATIEFARTSKLQSFLDLIPATGFPDWKQAVALYGEALGLNANIVSLEIGRCEASGQPGLPDSVARPDADRVQQGLALIASTGTREAAMGSLFGRCLSEALEGGGANDGGVVTVRGAFDFVRRRIVDSNINMGHIAQRPELHTVGSGDIVGFPLTARHALSPLTPGKRLALVTATDTYAEPDLIGTTHGGEHDSKVMAGLLQSHGAFDVSLLLGRDATRHSILAELSRLSGDLGVDDCILFYFSGHGGFFGDRNDLSLFLSDTKTEEPWSGLALREFAEVVRQSRVGSVIIILDTSYSSSAAMTFM